MIVFFTVNLHEEYFKIHVAVNEIINIGKRFRMDKVGKVWGRLKSIYRKTSWCKYKEKVV